MAYNNFKGTSYKLKSLCCGSVFEDSNWNLDCPQKEKNSLIRAEYSAKQLKKEELPGIYQYADWLPIAKILEGSGAPVTFKSEKLAKKLGLSNLYITFNGWWPEKGAQMKSGTFKECEAFSVCARKNTFKDKVMVVASAGNTARAFARVCSENKIPLLIAIPEDNINALWFEKPLDPCVKIIASESGADYFDAISLSNIACEMDMFYPEGGAKNVARRDGMGTTVLSAVTTIGRIPDYYFQAVGSGTGAIAAWESNLRLIADGRFGSNKMRLFVSQNEPFLLIKDSWDAKSHELLPLDADLARKQVEVMDAKVLSNRKPPYSMIGGLFDALNETNGDVLSVSNADAKLAADLFLETEGIDIEPAASVAVGSLIQAINNNQVEKDATIMLNITGGGAKRFKKENNVVYAKPSLVFPIDPDKEVVKAKLKELFA